MRSFPKVFSKFFYFLGYCANNLGIFRALKSEDFLGFSKKVPDEHTYHFYIKSPPPGFWLSAQVKSEEIQER